MNKRSRMLPRKNIPLLLSSLVVVVLFSAAFPSTQALSVTTFNMLAPVHRSMPGAGAARESERDEWWRPRAEYLAQYVSTEFQHSEVVLLQEWWFHDEFEQVFDYHVSPYFHRVAERRPNRDDGMAVLIRKHGELELVESQPVLTDHERIAQLVYCRHVHDHDRQVAIANVHLSFPYSPHSILNQRRQARQVQKVTCALQQQHSVSTTAESRLEILAGDFNSHSAALAARSVEALQFVNCASATAEQALLNNGGQVNLGITHKQHDGLLVSVDHVFCRMITPQSNNGKDENILRPYGYLDAAGTRVVDCVRGDLELDCPSGLLVSDHRPVTATLEWPTTSEKEKLPSSAALFDGLDFCNSPLDPLEPPSYMGGFNVTAATLIGNLRP